MTTSERMQYFRELYTNAWHARRYFASLSLLSPFFFLTLLFRHHKAQEFLDRFVRQNIAEIDEIKSEEHLEYVELTPPERAIYLELEHYLQVLPTFLYILFLASSSLLSSPLLSLLLIVDQGSRDTQRQKCEAQHASRCKGEEGSCEEGS